MLTHPYAPKRRRVLPAAVAALALVIAACDGGLTESEYIERARTFLEEGAAQAAVIELRNAVQANPENPESRALLGEVYLAMGQSADAVNQLQRAVSLGGDDPRIRVMLAEARLLQGDYEGVLDGIPVDEVADDAAAARLLVARGFAELQLGRPDAAAAVLAEAIDRTPTAGAYAGLVQVALAENDTTAARQHVEEGLAHFPDSPDLLIADGQRLLLDRGFETAAERFAAALERQPYRDDARIGLARARMGSGDYEAAAAALEPLGDGGDAAVLVAVLRAIIDYRAGDYEAALRDADEALREDPGNPAALYIAGASSFTLGRDERALRLLGRYVSVIPGDADGRTLLAATQVRLGDRSGAYHTLREAPEDLDLDAAYLVNLDTAAQLAGADDAGVRYLEQAALLSPDDAALRARLGARRLSAGDVEQGLIDLEQAFEADPELTDAAVALITTHMRAGDFERALDAARTFRERHPDNSDAHTLMAMVYLATGQGDAARAALEHAREINPGDRNAADILGRLAVRDEDWEAARAAYAGALEHRPGDERLLLALARIEALAGRPREGLAHLEAAVEANPESLPARLALSRVYLSVNRPADALRTVSAVAGAHPDHAALLEVLGNAHLMLGRTEQAIATFRALVEAQPEAPVAHRYLAEAYEASGDVRAAMRSLDEALRLAPDDPQARFARARLLAAAGEVDQAEAMLASLSEAYPDSAEIPILRGDLALAAGRPEQAESAFRRALELEETNINLTRLALAQIAAGDADRAERTMTDWLERYPEDLRTRMILADLYMAREDYREAAAQYQAVLDDHPDSRLVRNNLAWALVQIGEPERALEHAAAAHRAAPDNPQVLDTYGVALLELGETGRALELLEAAAAGAPEDPAIRFHHARALAAADEPDAAQAILDDLLASDRPFPGRDEAEALAEELAEP